MHLYLISQNTNTRYDTFDSAVVCAATEEEARLTHPSERPRWIEHLSDWRTDDSVWSDAKSWAAPSSVTVELLGDATPGRGPGVVCASFNAG